MKFFWMKKSRLGRSKTGASDIKGKISSSGWLMVIAITAVAGYFVGAQNQQIMGLIAPIFGQKVYTADVDLSAVEATFRALKANYDGTLSDQTLLEGASRGLVSAAGDKYTLYMDAEEATSFDDDLSGNIGGGIGAEIGLRDSKVVIVRVLDDNPAATAGLKAGDKILKVNDESTDGWTVEQAVNKIRGEVGTTVKLTILRASDTKAFSVTRATVINPSVYHSIEDGVGILTISRFDSETYTLARAAANDMVSKDVKGVVLDLRYNGGGYVDAAQNVAGLWLDNKVVVSERTGGRVVDELKSGSNPILTGIPVVVLVNSSSASASEIVAGALQDYGVAKVVGEATFGKGSVQKLVGLPDGAQLKVTIARWYTPNGKNITQNGIIPDVKANLTQEDIDAGRDPQMDAAINSLGL